MNLEQIDTSTTAGKAEVMRLAAEGRKVAVAGSGFEWAGKERAITWNWERCDYAIISEPVGPDELWCVIGEAGGYSPSYDSRVKAEARALDPAGIAVRYIRADLAGEKCHD